jgi:transcription elongation factor Elf1
MSYIGVITCSSCGQKVSITPSQVLVDRDAYGYFCRRCRNEGDIPEGFEFKHPTKKNLSVSDAIRHAGKHDGEGLFSKIWNFLFSKDI